MRILMLTWEYPPIKHGGIATHVNDLSRFLSDRGHEVHVICPGNGGEKFEDGVYVHRLELPFAPDIITWSSAITRRITEEALKIKKEHGIDVVHGHDWMMVMPSASIKHSLRVPFVFTIHSTENGRTGVRDRFSRMINDLEWLGTYEADSIITVGKDFMNEIKHLFHPPEEKMHYIPNGIDEERFNMKPTVSRDMFAGDWEDLVFFVGRMTWQKGVEYLLWAIPEILRRYPDAKFVLSGKGPGLEYYKSLAWHLGIWEKVYFTGFVPDDTLVSLYKVADVSAIPSIYEPFGIVALEASISKTPPVGSYVGGLKETIIHQKTGLHTYPANPQSIADQMVSLLEDPRKRKIMGRKAREYVLEDFNWRRISAWTEEVYHKALS